MVLICLIKTGIRYVNLDLSVVIPIKPDSCHFRKGPWCLLSLLVHHQVLVALLLALAAGRAATGIQDMCACIQVSPSECAVLPVFDVC